MITYICNTIAIIYFLFLLIIIIVLIIRRDKEPDWYEYGGPSERQIRNDDYNQDYYP